MWNALIVPIFKGFTWSFCLCHSCLWNAPWNEMTHRIYFRLVLIGSFLGRCIAQFDEICGKLVNSVLEHKIKLCDVDGLRESNFEQKVQEKSQIWIDGLNKTFHCGDIKYKFVCLGCQSRFLPRILCEMVATWLFRIFYAKQMTCRNKRAIKTSPLPHW